MAGPGLLRATTTGSPDTRARCRGPADRTVPSLAPGPSRATEILAVQRSRRPWQECEYHRPRPNLPTPEDRPMLARDCRAGAAGALASRRVDHHAAPESRLGTDSGEPLPAGEMAVRHPLPRTPNHRQVWIAADERVERVAVAPSRQGRQRLLADARAQAVAEQSAGRRKGVPQRLRRAHHLRYAPTARDDEACRHHEVVGARVDGGDRGPRQRWHISLLPVWSRDLATKGPQESVASGGQLGGCQLRVPRLSRVGAS